MNLIQTNYWIKIVILVIGLNLSSCGWTKEYVRPSYSPPTRPEIQIGVKERADRFIKERYPNIDTKIFEDYIIEHKDEFKKDVITRLKLKAHIFKLENLLEACGSGTKNKK